MFNALWKLAIRISVCRGQLPSWPHQTPGLCHPSVSPPATQSPDVRVDTGLCSLNQEQYKATFTQQPAWEIKANISRFILDCRGSWCLISAHGLLFCLWKLTQDAITHHNTVKRRIWQLQDVFVKIFMINTYFLEKLHFAISDKTGSIVIQHQQTL